MTVKALAMAVAVMFAVATSAAGQTLSSKDLVASMAKELGSSTQQAEGATGSLLSLAQSKLKPEDWGKVAKAIPGVDSLLKAAPTTPVGTTGIPGASSAAGGLAGVAGAFSKLGLSPELVSKAIPILTSFVTKNGGGDVGKLLASAFK
jgi:hypothetical protein